MLAILYDPGVAFLQHSQINPSSLAKVQFITPPLQNYDTPIRPSQGDFLQTITTFL